MPVTHQAFDQALCPIFQQSLRNIAGQNAGYLSRQQTGFLDSLVSVENRRGFEQIEISTPNGSVRGVEVYFVQPSNPLNSITNTKNACPTDDSDVINKTPKATVIPLSDFKAKYTKSLVLSEAEVQKICFASSDDYKAQLIMSEMNNLIVSVNQSLIDIALQNNAFGATYNNPIYTTTTPISAPLITGGNTANYASWSKIVKNTLRQIRVYNRPLVVGAGIDGIALYADLLSIGCCNDGGIDLSRANGQMAFFYDQDFSDIMSPGNSELFGAYAPGAMQLITYNEYGGGASNPRRRVIPGVYEHDTIMDPFTGLEFDFKLQYDQCSEYYYIVIGIQYYLWSMPDDMYEVGDPMEKTKASVLFDATS